MSKGGSIMLWACVAASGMGNISRVEGRMDLVKFQQILEAPSVKKLKMKRGWLLPKLLLRALFLFCYFETVKDGNKKVILLKILKKCVIFNFMPFGNQVIFYSLSYSQ